MNNWLKKNYRGLLGAQKKKTELISDLQMITFSKYYCFVKYENVGIYFIQVSQSNLLDNRAKNSFMNLNCSATA